MKNKKIIIALICIVLIIGIIVCTILFFNDINLQTNKANEENFGAGIEGASIGTASIGTALLENDVIVAERTYTEEINEPLFKNLLVNGEKFQIGKKYDERLCVRNPGGIDSFVRVIIRKNWTTQEGKEDSTLDKELIELGIASEEDGWIYTEHEESERIVLYYKNKLSPGENTSNFINYIRVNPSVQSDTNIVEKETGNGYKTVNVTKTFYGYHVNLEIEVDAVQTHSAHDAILDAWNVDATISADGNTIVSINN